MNMLLQSGVYGLVLCWLLVAMPENVKCLRLPNEKPASIAPTSFLEVKAEDEPEVDKQVLKDIETLKTEKELKELSEADDAEEEPEDKSESDDEAKPEAKPEAEDDGTELKETQGAAKPAEIADAGTLPMPQPPSAHLGAEDIHNDLLPKYNAWIKQQADGVAGMAGKMKQKAIQIHAQARDLDDKGTKIDHLGKKLATQADSMRCVAGLGHCNDSTAMVSPPALV